MMKIHTTQNLSSSVDYRSTNILLPKQIRYTKYSDSTVPSDTLSTDSVSFKGKKSALNKAIEAGKQNFSERVANMKGIKKLLGSDSFAKVAKFTGEQEVMIQSGTALAICCGLRPATIMALPGDKNKKDCAYASAHSISSGIWGFIVPLIFIKPVVSGYNNAVKYAYKYLDKESLLQRSPHINADKLKNADGTFKALDELVDREGNKFIADIKDVRKIPKPKHISEITNETLERLVPGIDLSSRAADGSLSNLVDKNGNKLEMKLEDMFIAVGEEGKSDKVQYYPLMHVKDTILEEVFGVDKSSLSKEGKRLHPKYWTKDGKPFELDTNKIFISDWNESDKAIPFVTGEVNMINGKAKEVCYQKNNIEGDPYSTGTPILTDMIEAEKVNKVFDKFCGWLPDIVVAYPRATATIAIIPFVLKNCLGLEKTPKNKEVAPKVEAQPTSKEVA